ncbi:MAG: S41 family peptidase [Pseudomonadota bacterium]|nr:S41 family peptidase [Pseudomonadota bacterium]
MRKAVVKLALLCAVMGVQASELTVNDFQDMNASIREQVARYSVERVSDSELHKAALTAMVSTLNQAKLIAPNEASNTSRSDDPALQPAAIEWMALDAQNTQHAALLRLSSASSFQAAQLLEELATQQPAAIIVDLRGLRSEAYDQMLDVAAAFLAKGSVMSQEKKRDSAGDYVTETHEVSLDGKWLNVPLGVLVDKQTAGAAEVLVAALVDNQRAKVFGQPTSGFAPHRIRLPLEKGYQLELINGFYYSPKGHNIDSVGIEPMVKLSESDLGQLPASFFIRYL